MKITKIMPCGYCKGVADALKIIDNTIKQEDIKPIYCMNQIVHNDFVNQSLLERGVVILEGEKRQLLENISSGTVVFSAHGTDPNILKFAKEKGLNVINTICPWVKKVMELTLKYIDQGYEILYIGKKGHPEAEAECALSTHVHLISCMADLYKFHFETEKVVITNQTTMSITSIAQIYEEAKRIFPNIIILDEVCNATRIRQEAVIKACESIDGLIVVGDKKSNNTTNLAKIGKNKQVDTIMIEHYKQIVPNWLENKKHIGVASGTSTPMNLVDETIHFLKSFGDKKAK